MQILWCKCNLTMTLNFLLQSKSNSMDYNPYQIHGLTIHGKINVALKFCNDFVFSTIILIKFHEPTIHGKLDIVLLFVLCDHTYANVVV